MNSAYICKNCSFNEDFLKSILKKAWRGNAFGQLMIRRVRLKPGRWKDVAMQSLFFQNTVGRWGRKSRRNERVMVCNALKLVVKSVQQTASYFSGCVIGLGQLVCVHTYTHTHTHLHAHTHTHINIYINIHPKDFSGPRLYALWKKLLYLLFVCIIQSTKNTKETKM